MALRLLYSVIFLLFCVISYSQTQWNITPYKSIGLASNQGFEIYDSNYGIQVEAFYNIKKYRLVSGVDLRVIDWGNQVSVYSGLQHTIYKNEIIGKGEFTIDVIPKIHILIPLYQNDFLLGLAGQLDLITRYRITNRFSIGSGFGLRYNLVPGYKKYGDINSVLELPIYLSLGFQF